MEFDREQVYIWERSFVEENSLKALCSLTAEIISFVPTAYGHRLNEHVKKTSVTVIYTPVVRNFKDIIEL